MIRRRGIRHLIAALVLLLVAAACRGTDSGGPATQPGTHSSPLPMDQQVLTVGTLADDYTFGPNDRPSLGKYPLNTSVFDTLVRMEENLQVEPLLAERWEYNEPTNTYRFFLRRGVKFHDGAELTSEDVKYTFGLINKATPTNYQQIGPDSVKVVDPYTFDFTPLIKNLRSIEQLVHPHFGINRTGSYDNPTSPVGSGPYRFVEYVKNDRFVVERFEGYWNPERAAKAKRITFKFVPDAQTRILALRAGDLDLIMDVPRDAAGELEATPGLQVIRSNVGAYNALNFNIAGIPPYDLGKDPVIREAISIAIDRKAVLNRVWAGNAEESNTWIPPTVLGPEAGRIKGPIYDPRRAAQLLDQAGWVPGGDGIRVKDGRRLALVHMITGPGDSDPRDSVAAAEFIQDQLKRVGVEIKIELPELAAGSARQTRGEYDIAHAIGNQNEGNPCFLPDLSYYSKAGGAARFRGPGGKVDEAIEGCRVAATIADARRFSAEAIHQLVDVERVLIPLIGLYRIWGMKGDLAGFTPHPSLNNQRLEGVYRVKTK